MTNSKHNNEVISVASPHTIKKFELIEKYVEAWAHKLLEYGRKTGNCNAIVFIDCMSNSGTYISEATGKTVEGTPVRVAKLLSSIMREENYQQQRAVLYFNDLSEEKITELKRHLPKDTHNFHIETSSFDANDLLKSIGKCLSDPKLKFHYLLIYDPYQATIDWEALFPFIRNWGEVIINHMVSDPIRAVSQVKRPEAISKYEQTYMSGIEELIKFGSDRDAFEQRIREIITSIKGGGDKRYYIASYPFFNSKNAVVYNLLHCTGNIAGFKLYKSTAWQTFGDKSSTKKSHFNQDQLIIDFDGNGTTTQTDEDCFTVKDIAKFLQNEFAGQKNVTLNTLWRTLDEHPIFPSDGFKPKIKEELRETYGADTKKRGVISFRK